MSKKRTTIRDVARRAQVAPITVSRVVNNQGYISPETRQRVEAAIQELNYIPNTLAQSLRHQKTNMVALIVTDIANPFWTTVARGVEDICNAHKVNLIVCNTDEQQSKLDNYINLLIQRQIDGLIIVPTEGYSGAMLDNLFANHVPSIILDRVLPNWHRHTVVRGDSVTGGYLLTKHMLELGHRRIMMLSGSSAVSTGLERAEGYQRALREFGVALDPTLLRFGQFNQQSGYNMTLDILDHVVPRPTAIVTANNFIAFGVQKALDDRGVNIPGEMSLATFDDLPAQINPRPFLTTIVQNPYTMGQEAAQRLIALLTAGDSVPIQDIVLPVSLIVRASTAPPHIG
ncbi:MAG: LacI family DNA-binding transcriptional regulator [Anaerolinea sp.]|nr:LacI family DNA-binding transcriptional regulator [Anaerolinea sp.]